MSQCECCKEPLIFSPPVLRVKQFAAEGSKCGFSEFGDDPSTPPKLYKRKKDEVTWYGSWMKSWHRVRTYENPPPADRVIDSSYGISVSGYCVKIAEYTPGAGSAGCAFDPGEWSAPNPLMPYLTETLEKSLTCSGPGCGTPSSCTFASTVYEGCGGASAPEDSTSGTAGCDDLGIVELDLPDPAPGEGFISSFVIAPPDKTMMKTTEWEGCVAGCTRTRAMRPWPLPTSYQSYGSETISGAGTTKITESNLLSEYTTGELISTTEAALTLYTDSESEEAVAVKELSPDELSYGIQKAEVIIKHPPTFTGYLKVWLEYSIDGGASGEWEIYEWTQPTGTADPTTEIESSPYSLDPDGSSPIRVRLQKWSMLPDYTPTSGQTNGLPEWTPGGLVP